MSQEYQLVRGQQYRARLIHTAARPPSPPRKIATVLSTPEGFLDWRKGLWWSQLICTALLPNWKTQCEVRSWCWGRGCRSKSQIVVDLQKWTCRTTAEEENIKATYDSKISLWKERWTSVSWNYTRIFVGLSVKKKCWSWCWRNCMDSSFEAVPWPLSEACVLRWTFKRSRAVQDLSWIGYRRLYVFATLSFDLHLLISAPSTLSDLLAGVHPDRQLLTSEGSWVKVIIGSFHIR